MGRPKTDADSREDAALAVRSLISLPWRRVLLPLLETREEVEGQVDVSSMVRCSASSESDSSKGRAPFRVHDRRRLSFFIMLPTPESSVWLLRRGPPPLLLPS
jgi:hypothetical protein